MTSFKLVISSSSTGTSAQVEVKDQQADSLMGKKIGDKIAGKDIGFSDYEFELTGGSDYCGFPMRRDVQGTGRKRILAIGGVGIKTREKGIKQRKTVCGNTVHAKITQVNLKILKKGGAEIAGLAEKAPEKKKKEKPAADAKEEKKPAIKAEEKKAAPKKPAEQAKPKTKAVPEAAEKKAEEPRTKSEPKKPEPSKKEPAAPNNKGQSKTD